MEHAKEGAEGPIVVVEDVVVGTLVRAAAAAIHAVKTRKGASVEERWMVYLDCDSVTPKKTACEGVDTASRWHLMDGKYVPVNKYYRFPHGTEQGQQKTQEKDRIKHT